MQKTATTIQPFIDMIDTRIVVLRRILLDDGGVNDGVVEYLPSSLVEFLVAFGLKLLLNMGESEASLEAPARIRSKDAVIEVLE